MAYQLKLPDDSIIHPVFHISQLKQFHEDYTPVYAELPRVTDLALANTSPEAVLERRLVKKGNVAIPQVKVKWAGLHEDCATWEDLYVVKTHFPSSSVWGQPQISAGGGERSQPWRICIPKREGVDRKIRFVLRLPACVPRGERPVCRGGA